MKRTRKFVTAEETARKIGINVDTDIYKNLEQQGYFWISERGKWVKAGPPDIPTNLLKIRVWADGRKIQQDCEGILEALDPWFILEEQSGTYCCLPPKQLESRIYLTFRRRP
ncbi:hypothetical protein Xen7305DRAFT_00045590 [Xenococcus sp. PCC 7305]|uniref:hypothetical protein n=1 Tax=Xenococcus sp. PCC 7305 TaxID=102125 RepID=UPI0002AC71BF|nr:hypothetical protein [Xenococcus sp. PCC 7305]ELS04823.1 hypothetical protein Xen7305DRAFT_00045590 [Xenococcus sp. PCC 7305]